MPARTVIAALASTAGLLLAAPSPAVAHEVRDAALPVLDPNGTAASNTHSVTAAGDGSVLIAYEGSPLVPPTEGRVRLVWQRPNGTLTRPVDVTEPGHGSFPEVGADREGDAVVGWNDYDVQIEEWQAYVRQVPRSGPPGPPLLLSEPSTNYRVNSVAVRPDGHAVVLYESVDVLDDGYSTMPHAWARTLSASGRLGPVIDLGRTWFATSVVTCRRSFVVAHLREDDVFLSRISAGSQLTTVNASRDVGHRVGPSAVQCDRKGNAHLLRVEKPELAWPETRSVMTGRVWRASGGLSKAVRLGGERRHIWNVTSATNPRGDTLVAWVRISDDAEVTLRAQAWHRDGTTGAVRELGAFQHTPGGSSIDILTYPTLALAPDGSGEVSWDVQPTADRTEVRAARLGPDMRWRPRRLVAQGEYPALAPRGNGRPTLVFAHGEPVPTLVVR